MATTHLWYIRMKLPPPIPDLPKDTTPTQNVAAIAASIAEPPYLAIISLVENRNKYYSL